MLPQPLHRTASPRRSGRRLVPAAVLLGLLLMLGACAVAPSQPAGAGDGSSELSDVQQARKKFLEHQILVRGFHVEQLEEYENLFSLVSAIESQPDEALAGKHFFLRDTVGLQEDPRFDPSFYCVAVLERGSFQTESGQVVSLFGALYRNPHLDSQVTIVWGGTQPLKGELLNVDYLIFKKADVNVASGRPAKNLVFIHPQWSDEQPAPP